MFEVGTFTWIADPDGGLVGDLPAWRQVTGQSVEQLLGNGWVEAVHPDDRDRVFSAWRETVAQADPWAVEYRIADRDGGYHTVAIHGVPVLGEDGAVQRYVGMGQDVTEVTLDRTLLRAVVDAAPIGIAVTWGPHFVFRLHNEPYRDLLPPGREVLGLPVAQAIPEAGVVARFEQVRELGVTLRFTDFAVPWEGEDTFEGHRWYEFSLVPIQEREKVGGVLIVAVETTEDVRRRRILEEQLHAERRVAETLQRGLLPDVPRIPWLEVAVRYLPAGPDVEVGGDWYDAFPLPDGCTAIVVGDIAGRGVEAARLMSQVRAAARAYGIEGGGPEDVVARVERFFAAQELGDMATMLYGELSPDRRTLTWVNAGHPPPVLVPPGGPGRLLRESLGPPIGAGAAPASAARIELEPGSTLLLYTDGLVEDRGRPLEEGLATLVDVCGRTAADGPDPLCDEAIEVLVSDRAGHDDVALVAVRTAAAS